MKDERQILYGYPLVLQTPKGPSPVTWTEDYGQIHIDRAKTLQALKKTLGNQPEEEAA